MNQQLKPLNLPIILASASKRRAAILTQIGLTYSVIESAFSEKMIDEIITLEKAKEIVLYNATGKAREVSEKTDEGIIIGCDTLVYFDDKVMGKPKNKTHAVEMLTVLSEKKHTVVSGLCVIIKQKDKSLEYYDTEESDVWFRKLTHGEIQSYVDTGEPLDKAGSYGIQEKGAVLIEKVNGDYYNVVGLPLPKLLEIFKKLNISYI